MNPYVIEDLGEIARGNLWYNWRIVRHPGTGEEFALGGLNRTGFALIDPRKKSSLVVRGERPFHCAEGVTQAPNGDIYVAEYGRPNPRPHLCAWNWHGERARVVAEIPALGIMTIDAGADGRMYMPDYTQNTVFRFDPATGQVDDLGRFDEFGAHTRDIFGGQDGLLYIRIYDNDPERGLVPSVVVVDPRTSRRSRVDTGDVPCERVNYGTLVKDAAGRVLMAATHWGRPVWHELRDGRLHPIAPELVRLNPGHLPLCFSDGSYIRSVRGREVAFVDSRGRVETFSVDRDEAPLRIFSVSAGGGKVWCNSFMPLTLSSYDPLTRRIVNYGNPTRTEGEAYSSCFVRGKLFMACYVDAHVVRFDPSRPFDLNDTVRSNPGTLGLMKTTGLPLHRPYGNSVAPDGTVYFAALGDYGCLDSGISRIDPSTEQMTNWIYPRTTIWAIAHLRTADELLVAERRGGESAIRMTRVRAGDGSVIDSTPVIEDKGEIHSLLVGDAGIVYGLHGHRATLFAYDVARQQIVASLPEMRVGTHCRNALIDGPDGRIWGLTDQAVFAVTRDLRTVAVIGEYPHRAMDAGNRFGFCYGEDGHAYFATGTHLMRVRTSRGGT